MWQIIAGEAVMAGLGNVLSGNKQMAAIENRVSAANAQAGNKVRGAANTLAAAQGALARWSQSLDNNRKLKAGGNVLEATTVNALRQQDAGTVASFSDQIRSAEAQGAAEASQAFAGVSGDVVDMVNVSTSLRNSIVAERTKDLQRMGAWDTGRQLGGIMQQMTASLDSSMILEGLDHNTNVANVKYGGPSALQAMLGGALKGAVKSAANGTFSLDGIPGADQWFQSSVKANLSPVKAGQQFGFRPPVAASASMYSLI